MAGGQHAGRVQHVPRGLQEHHGVSDSEQHVRAQHVRPQSGG